MSIEQVETLIIGGGQAGLAISQQLSKRDRPHIVLERHRIAERWRTERWDGLRFQAPNNMVSLSDFSFPYTDPDGFSSAKEIADYIIAFAKAVAAPVRCGVAVMALRRLDHGSGFFAVTSAGPIEARNVVVATGPFQRPVIPALLAQETKVFQVHSCGYRNPDQLPAGAVLVIGAGASGAQIAEELRLAGRRVYLSVSRHRRLPRRYRGHDFRWWWTAMGTLDTPLEKRGSDQSPNVVTGAYGGYTIDFRRFAAQGTVLLGRAEAMRDGVMTFVPVS